ncbi:hypothetical protein K4K53_000415 [Colletotrichum sp. SAR 10_77]|nr:hypothetical protein K4K53_000415 [Colletotrichum sp. SAR 10_77]
MCQGNTATVVENVSLEHLQVGNNGHIKWCPGAIRSMYAHLATHKLDSRTCQHVGLNSLLAKLNCIHEDSDYPSLVNPRIVRKLGSLISELVDMGILKQGSSKRTVVWPQWTDAWTLTSWTGDIGPPSVVPGEEQEQLELLKAPVAAGDDDVMSWVPLPKDHGDTAHSDQLEASRERLDGLIASVKEIQLVMISERESDMVSILESIQRAIVTGQQMHSAAPLVQGLDSLCRGQACEVQQPGQDRHDRQELSHRLREAQLGVTELRAALAVGDGDVIVRVEGLGLEEGKNGTADVHLLTQQLDHLVMTGS